PNVTGCEVANQLARGGAARVRVACRTVPNLVARKFFGVTVNVPGLALTHLPLRVADEVAWLMQRILFVHLDRYGLPRSPEGSRPRWHTKHRRTTTGSSRNSGPGASRLSPRSSASTKVMSCWRTVP